MTKPRIGFEFDTQELESLVPSSDEMSVIGATVIAPNKDAGVENNTLYSITTDDAAFYNSLGTGGTGQDTIDGVAKQLGAFGKSTRMVVNVVEEGVDDDATITNIVGNATTKTGVHAFKQAGQKVNVIPRILIAPGFTSQQATVDSVLQQNAVCAEFATVCESLLAVACVTGPSTTKQAALDWRETIGSKRLIPTDTDVIVQGNGGPVQKPSDAYIAGLINRVDELHGGMPFHSAGNRQLTGVLGPALQNPKYRNH